MRLLLLLFILAASPPSHAQDPYLLVGTYDSPLSRGLHVFRFNTATGEMTPVSYYKIPNPSFVTVSPDQRFVYAVQETSSQQGSGGKVTAFAFHKQSGTLSLLNEQNTGGDHPCHLEMDRSGAWLCVANYSGGSLSVLPVLPGGALGTATEYKQTGSGPHPRQKASHVHGSSISPGNHQLITTNLGTDRLIVYDLDKVSGSLTMRKHAMVAAEPGSGPRLSRFHPNGQYLYVIEELSGTVAMYRYRHGKLKRKQRITTMLAGDTSFAGSAHLAVSADGKFLYASNRGTANNIAIFSIKKGRLTPRGHQSSLGRGPRNFSIDPSGNYLLVGNQNSDEIVVFERNTITGKLADSFQRVKLGRPACLQWINY